MNRQKYKQTFTGFLNTVLAPKLLGADQYVYMLNCDISSTDEGNMGMITNIKGNVSIPVELPPGENRTIHSLRDEENGKMYYAVWNSLGYHSWYLLDYTSKTVQNIMQCITDTAGDDIWRWEKDVLINSANIVGDNLLYWTMQGQPARKINIRKSIEKSFDNGYGNVIIDEYTRAYKKAPEYPPTVEYFTDTAVRSNKVFRKLFKFAARYVYDDNEYSTFSDFSRVAVPSEEDVTGTRGVPLINNGLSVVIPTGGMIVKKIEIIMQSTTDVKGVYSDWVSIGVFDKNVLGIDNNTSYEYKFYNDTTFLSINQAEVNQQQSDLPDNPLTQELSYNTLVYGNFMEGFPALNVDLGFEVKYSDLFIPSGQANVLNEPSIRYNHLDHIAERKFFSTWRHTIGEIVIGPDVKAGNIFRTWFINDPFDKTIVATLNDSAQTIASYFRSQFATNPKMNSGGGYVENVVPAGGGSYKFKFRVWNNDGKPYILVDTSSVPVNYSKLKDTGNSVPNEKLGSSRKYGIDYRSVDGKRSLTYGTDEAIEVRTINSLGEIKKVQVEMTINHKAPEWAARCSVKATKNLTNPNSIDLLIQRVSKAVESDGGEYQDLIIGSLFTYLKVHPNSTLSYDFKKGDRVRLKKNFANNVWTVPNSVIDYEIIDYVSEFRYDVNENIVIDGSSTVKVATPDINNVGNNVVINGVERTVISVSSDGYVLDSDLTIEGASSSAVVTYPAYEIVNRNGIIRIKVNPEYPIEVDAAAQKFALVEVFTPGQSTVNADYENYYDIGYNFEIYKENGVSYHRGNLQDQTATQPAKIIIEGFDNFVRNRELITNNDEKNPQVTVTSIEDNSYSDFYQSNLTSLGRPSRIDDSRGVVHFEDRIAWSNNFIEDTKINGLNMFLSTNRVDYNDKYGSIQKVLFYEGRLFVFKYLKTGWVPVMGNLITDTNGQSFVGISTKLLPNKMEYFLWEGGVGSNPESIVKEGNSIFGVSPTSQVVFEIGGSGLIPTSKQYGIDNYARKLIVDAKTSGAHIYGGINRKKNQYVITIGPYNSVVYSERINTANTAVIPVEESGVWSIVSGPSNGSASLNDDVINYSPNNGFSGIDAFSYRSGSGLVRNSVIRVLDSETKTEWRPAGQYCVMGGGVRTGEVGYSTLEEYDIISESYTGLVKGNESGDVDYVAPFLDEVICPIGADYIKLGTLSGDKNAQTISFTIASGSDFNIQIRSGDDYSGSLSAETGVVGSGIYSLSLPVNGSRYSLFMVASNYADVTSVKINGSYFINASFRELPSLLLLSLDQSSIPDSHGLVFNSLDISANLLLTELSVINHRLTSFDLTNNIDLYVIDLSYGKVLSNLIIGNWSGIKSLSIHECLFTSVSYSTVFIDNVINTLSSIIHIWFDNMLRYGLDNNSGIRPSSAAKVGYDNLSNSFNIIGKAPLSSTSVNLTVTFGASQDEIHYSLRLSEPLPVDVQVISMISYMNLVDGIFYNTPDVIIIRAGDFLVDGYLGFPEPITAVSVVITSVTPNPANGIAINY